MDKKGFDIQLLEEFFNEHAGMFGLGEESVRPGVFSLGVLVRQVFNQQARALEGATPFDKKLQGFNLDARKLRIIYKDAIDKLNKYTSVHAYQELKAFVNDHFFLTNHLLDRVPNDELSFYFVAGLEYGNRFKSNTNNDNEQDTAE